MTIVSDTRSLFFDEIYETWPKPAYRISELTIEKINEFVDTGNAIDLLELVNMKNLMKYY